MFWTKRTPERYYLEACSHFPAAVGTEAELKAAQGGSFDRNFWDRWIHQVPRVVEHVGKLYTLSPPDFCRRACYKIVREQIKES